MIGLEGPLGAERSGEHAERLRGCLVLLLDEPVIDPRPIASAIDDARRLQNPEMPRRRRLVEVERRLEVTDAQLAMREQRDDAHAGFVTQRSAEPRDRANL